MAACAAGRGRFRRDFRWLGIRTVPKTLGRARRLKRNRAAMGRMMAKSSVRNRISPQSSGSEGIAPDDAGTDGGMPPDGSASAEISDGLESERVPRTLSRARRLKRKSSGDGLDGGADVSAEPDQSASSGSEGIAPDDAGTDARHARRTGALPPRFQMVWNPNASRTLSRCPKAETESPKAETESSGDGSDGGEGVSTEPDQSATSGSEDIAPDDAGTDGDAPPDNGDFRPRFQMVRNPNASRTLSRARRLKRGRAATGRMAAKASTRNRTSPRPPDLKMAVCR